MISSGSVGFHPPTRLNDPAMPWWVQPGDTMVINGPLVWWRRALWWCARKLRLKWLPKGAYRVERVVSGSEVKLEP